MGVSMDSILSQAQSIRKQWLQVLYFAPGVIIIAEVLRVILNFQANTLAFHLVDSIFSCLFWITANAFLLWALYYFAYVKKGVTWLTIWIFLKVVDLFNCFFQIIRLLNICVIQNPLTTASAQVCALVVGNFVFVSYFVYVSLKLLKLNKAYECVKQQEINKDSKETNNTGEHQQ